MTAWILMIWIGAAPVAIPSIATETECKRLAPLIGGDSQQWKCIPYEVTR